MTTTATASSLPVLGASAPSCGEGIVYVSAKPVRVEKHVSAGIAAFVIDARSFELLAFDAEQLESADSEPAAHHLAIQLGLRLSKLAGLRLLTLRSDSKLAVGHVSRQYRLRRPGMVALAKETWKLARRFDRVSYEWVTFGVNAPAVIMASRALATGEISRPELSGVTLAAATETSEKQAAGPAGSEARRVQATASLAATYRLTGSVSEIVETLLDVAPDELIAIWGRLPSDLWLTQRCTRCRWSWNNGFGQAAGR